jgi:hypothetical protein
MASLNVNKLKTKSISKKAKTSHGCSEKWHGTHQKDQIVFEIEIRK